MDICWKTSKRYSTEGIPASKAMGGPIPVVRKALSLPVELLGFFGNLYLDPVLFCNTSICQPRLTTLHKDSQVIWREMLWSDFGIAQGGDGIA
jgi:hypothetical protein